MGTICLLKHRSTCEGPHICKLSSALRETVCGHLMGAQSCSGSHDGISSRVLPRNSLSQVLLLLIYLVSPMKLLSCVYGPGAFTFLVVGAGIPWSLSYFLPMFLALNGVDIVSLYCVLTPAFQGAKEGWLKTFGESGCRMNIPTFD